MQDGPRRREFRLIDGDQLPPSPTDKPNRASPTRGLDSIAHLPDSASLRPGQVAALLGVSTTKLRLWRRKRQGPPCFSITANDAQRTHYRYPVRAVRQYLREHGIDEQATAQGDAGMADRLAVVQQFNAAGPLPEFDARLTSELYGLLVRWARSGTPIADAEFASILGGRWAATRGLESALKSGRLRRTEGGLVPCCGQRDERIAE